MRDISTDIIRDAVNSRRDKIIEWAKTLIRFPSENRPPDGNEKEAQEFIKAECESMGFNVDIFTPDEIPNIQEHPSWLSGRNYANGRKDVVARWNGQGDGKSILISGHVDVAPFEPDAWKVCRPYEPIVKDGRLYGRGSADMKAGLTSAYWALRILRELGFKPAGNVLFESLVDEEFASGNGTLAARLRGHNADLAVVCEPTRMQVCPACEGAFLGSLTLRGKAGMPFMGKAIPNPVIGAAKAIELFTKWQEKWRAENIHPLFSEPGKELNVLLWAIESNEPEEFRQMGSPLFARISWIVWCYPGMTENDFYKRFQAFWREHSSDQELAPFSLELKPEFHYVKPWQTPVDGPGVQAVVKAFKEYEGISPMVGGAPFSCDLAIYGETGRMPSVLLGPRGDNVHAPDEWVEINDLCRLTGILANLIIKWCGEGKKD